MGMKKLIYHIDNSVFHTNTHQKHTVKYKGYVYIYKKNAFSNVYYTMKED